MDELIQRYLQEYKLVAKERLARKDLLYQVYHFVTSFFTKDKLEKATWEDFHKLGDNLFCYGPNAFRLKLSKNVLPSNLFSISFSSYLRQYHYSKRIEVVKNGMNDELLVLRK
jgi:hypothetical protein